ncbi:hypothetical protein ES708_29695 [subsurface metagenome]
MFKKMVTKYKRSGLLGVLLAGMSYEFRQTSKFFSNSAEWILTKIPISLNDKEILNRNQVFKNKHAGRRCFVIGNGPSLNKQDLSLLSNEITIVMNYFYKHPIVEKWQPNYYCLADPQQSDGSKKSEKFYQNLRQKIHSSKFLVPVYGKIFIENQKLLPLDQTYYAAFRGTLSNGLNYNNIDLTKSIPGVQNTSQLAMMWALYMGCSPIYLIGLDHDWLSNVSYPLSKHFYKVVDGVDYSKEKRVLRRDRLKATLDLWKGYETILRIIANKNISIINATEGGFLDVFERRKYKSIFLNPN